MATDQTKIALAGIIATAVVGLAGALTTIVATKQTNSTQRQIAHESETYSARASAYIDALSMETGWLQAQRGKAFQRWRRKLTATHATLRARIEAYGTDEALHAYDGLVVALTRHGDVPKASKNFHDVVRADLK